MITTTERVDDWIEGWCRARGVQRVREDGAWLVDVGAESRTRERILVDPSPSALQACAEQTAGPREWMTVIGLGDDARLAPAAGLELVAGDESLMAALLGPGSTAEGALLEGALLAGAVLEAADGVASVRLLVDGVVAAQGTAAVHGTVAVLDRIETDARFRRRGLGRRVVDALTAWARSEGARSGLLVASTDGRALYLTLGWEVVAPVRIWRGAALRDPGQGCAAAGR
ncbi:GNAT family N-acetyltransferase [Rathayibacter sp. AY1D3]|uniref:GNAT family N-acetyltransferase n=1 Tax=Rathayibacter sp. AY1D3 TaxID=2080544 RepID=UPI001CA5EF4F|nr:GNAT family N-acetyltransferase [Rathayibacter sp. AY1D3]